MKRLRRGADDEGEGADGDDDDDGDDELDIDQGDGGDDDDEGKSHRKAELSKDFFQVIENGADADADDGDRVDYEDLMMPAAMAQGGNDDHFHNPAGGPRSNSKKKAKTLLELAQGPNRDAATNMIEDSVYAMAIVCNFVSFRLVNSSGAKQPHLFDTANKEFVTRNPEFNVRGITGKPPPFLRDNKTDNAGADDMNL